MQKKEIKVVIITGPTATGKTSLAVKLAKKFNGEIISADSRQVYKGLDIGTGKDIDEYEKEGIKYHLIDIIQPDKTYNLRQFNNDAKEAIIELNKKKVLPIISGGTVSYIDSLISDYQFPLPPPDQELREKLKELTTEEIGDYIKTNNQEIYAGIDNKNSRPRLIRYYEKIISEFNNKSDMEAKRYSFEYLILGTFYSRNDVHKRIEERLNKRLQIGMIEEVENLHKQGVSWEKLDSFGLEYRYISQFLKNEIPYEEMYKTLLARIRKLARNQDIWFRKIENAGHKILWINKGNFLKSADIVQKFLNNEEIPESEFKLKEIYYGPKSKK